MPLEQDTYNSYSDAIKDATNYDELDKARMCDGSMFRTHNEWLKRLEEEAHNKNGTQ